MPRLLILSVCVYYPFATFFSVWVLCIIPLLRYEYAIHAIISVIFYYSYKRRTTWYENLFGKFFLAEINGNGILMNAIRITLRQSWSVFLRLIRQNAFFSTWFFIYFWQCQNELSLESVKMNGNTLTRIENYIGRGQASLQSIVFDSVYSSMKLIIRADFWKANKNTISTLRGSRE